VLTYTSLVVCGSCWLGPYFALPLCSILVNLIIEQKLFNNFCFADKKMFDLIPLIFNSFDTS
jgi:hypothetical protein